MRISAFCLGALLLAITASAADSDLPQELRLTVGRSTIVKFDLPIERIVVGYGDIAEASAASPYEVLVNGKTPGVTSLIVWQRGGNRRSFDVRVNASTFLADTRADAVRHELGVELPGQNIS